MRFRCTRCGDPPAGFQFEADAPACPMCGMIGMPFVHSLVDVHFVVLDPRGPIRGSHGRQHIACMPKRQHLSLHPGDNFSASDHPEAVTCPSCQGTPAYRDMVQVLFPDLAREQAMRRAAGITVSGPGCCG